MRLNPILHVQFAFRTWHFVFHISLQHLDLRPRRPIDRHTAAHSRDEFSGDNLEFGNAHDLDCGLIRGERVVESDFIVGQAEVNATFGGFLHLLRQLDQFLDHFLRGDGPIVVSMQAALQEFGKMPALDQIAFGADLDFVAEKLGEEFGGDVLVLEMANFVEEFLGENRDIRFLQPRGAENVDNPFICDDRFGNELADGVIELLG